jgi:hypothetical protein
MVDDFFAHVMVLVRSPGMSAFAAGTMADLRHAY